MSTDSAVSATSRSSFVAEWLVVLVVAVFGGWLLSVAPALRWLQWGDWLHHNDRVSAVQALQLVIVNALFSALVIGPLTLVSVAVSRRLRRSLAADLVAPLGFVVYPVASFVFLGFEDGGGFDFASAVYWSFVVWALLGYIAVVGVRVAWRRRMNTSNIAG